jgi:tetratricopeptide (TPR) repeat protein
MTQVLLDYAWDDDKKVQQRRAASMPSTQLVDVLVARARVLSDSNHKQALADAKEAHTLSRLLRYPTGIVRSLIRLSWLHLQDGRFDIAALEAREAEFLATRSNNYALQADAAYIVADIEQRAENFDKAETLWLRLLDLAHRHKDVMRQADYCTMLGILYEQQGNYERALTYKQYAHDLYLSQNDKQHIAAKNNLACVLIKTGKWEEALDWATQAYVLCQTQHSAWRAAVLHTLGVIAMQQGRLTEARATFEQSLSICTTLGNQPRIMTEVLLDLSKLELTQNRLPAAFDALDRAVSCAASAGAIAQSADAHHALYRLYSIARSPEQANLHHEKYLHYQHQLGCQRIDQQIQLIRVDAEVAQRQTDWLHAD